MPIIFAIYCNENFEMIAHWNEVIIAITWYKLFYNLLQCQIWSYNEDIIAITFFLRNKKKNNLILIILQSIVMTNKK